MEPAHVHAYVAMASVIGVFLFVMVLRTNPLLVVWIAFAAAPFAILGRILGILP